MITQAVEGLIEKYTKICSWYFIKEGDKDVNPKQFSIVLNEITDLENKLKENGIPDEHIRDLAKKIKEDTLGKTVGEMTDSELLKTCKLIFGNETEFEGGYTP